MRWLAILLALAIGLPAAEARPRDLFGGFFKAFAPAKQRVHRKKRVQVAQVRKSKPHPTKVAVQYRAKELASALDKGAIDKFTPSLDELYKNFPVVREPGWKQSGVASWYGPGFALRPTACGAIKGFTSVYVPSQMTAAHRNLKCGTRIEVHANGKVVDLTITDRGPYIPGRVLDVSEGAAHALGMVKSGTAKVTFYVIGQ